MQNAIQELYEHVNDLCTYEEFQQEIKIQFKHYNGLFNEETIALLVIDEKGRNNTAFTTIERIKENNEYTLQGIITDIQEIKEFKRKNGTPGKVANLILEDTTGNCRLVLWNKDTALIKQLNITPGTPLKIVNGYTKRGYNGIEIHLGRWGALERISPPVHKSQTQKQHVEEMIGTLTKKTHTNTFFKADGTIGFVTQITLKKHSILYSITLWDEHVKQIQQYSIGETLVLNGVQEKKKNNKTELHLHRSGKINKQS